MQVLSSIKHHKISIELHYRRIKGARGFEARALRGDDRLIGESIPFAKRHLELSGLRGSNHGQNYYKAPSTCATKSVLHGLSSFSWFGARAFIRHFFPELNVPQKSTARRNTARGRTLNVVGKTLLFSLIRKFAARADGMLIVPVLVTGVGL